MRSHARAVIGTIACISILMVLSVGFHVGGEEVLSVGVYSPLFGAFLGGTLTLFSVLLPSRREENGEPWLKREKLAWTLMGCACIAWAIGECFWRHYLALGQTPFPSLADIGYAAFPPLIFSGLILQPYSKSDRKRIFFFLDSLIAMGALLSIAWFLLLGPLSLTPVESPFARVLGIYYPTMDTAVVSGTIILLLRGTDRFYQARARRISLLVVSLGLAAFAISDFLFNLQQNLGTYKDGTWVDLGWPLGMMTLGVGAYLRRFLPVTLPEALEKRIAQRANQIRFELLLLLPYLLLVALFCALVFNVLSPDPTQQSIRPVLVAATMMVVSLVLVRQILTIFDNTHLLRAQKRTLQKLEQLNESIGQRNAMLEKGIIHLKNIQTRLANGDIQARASRMNGELWPLAVGLNLMADRMMRVENTQRQAQKLAKALDDFSLALSRTRGGGPFIPPVSSLDFPEIQRLLLATGLKPTFEHTHSSTESIPSDSEDIPPVPPSEQTGSFHKHKPPASDQSLKGGVRLYRDNPPSP